MTTFKEVLKFINAEPFRPFHMQIASGRDFEIQYPDMILVGVSRVQIYAPSEDNPNGPERWYEFPLSSVERIEPLVRAGQL